MWAPLEGHNLELGSSALTEQTAGGCLLTALCSWAASPCLEGDLDNSSLF